MKLSEHTYVSLGLLGMIIGAALWISHVAWKVDAAYASSEENRHKSEDIGRDISEIKNDVKWIKKALSKGNE